MDVKERLLGEEVFKVVTETDNKDLEKAVPELVKLLEDKDLKVKASYALSLIAQKVPASKAIKDSIPGLLNSLKDKETSLHGAIALGSVLQADPANKEIAQGISAHTHLFLAMMLDVDDFILQKGALLLGHVAQQDPDKVLELLSFFIEMLDFERWRSRWNALGIMGLILLKHPQNKDIIGAVPRFLELMGDESWQVRLNAVGISGSIADKNPALDEVKDIVAGLAMALKDENENVRVMASDWLSAIAEKNPENAKDAIPALEGVLKDPSHKVHENAEKALKALKG